MLLRRSLPVVHDQHAKLLLEWWPRRWTLQDESCACLCGWAEELCKLSTCRRRRPPAETLWFSFSEQLGGCICFCKSFSKSPVWFRLRFWSRLWFRLEVNHKTLFCFVPLACFVLRFVHSSCNTSRNLMEFPPKSLSAWLEFCNFSCIRNTVFPQYHCSPASHVERRQYRTGEERKRWWNTHANSEIDV